MPHRLSLDRSNATRDREGYYSDRNEMVRERERERGYLSDREQQRDCGYASDHNIPSLVFHMSIILFKLLLYLLKLIRICYCFIFNNCSLRI